MDNSKPAFPLVTDDPSEVLFKGLTKRELAAMFAMAGFLANQLYMGSGQREGVATEAVAQADALLAALKEKKP